MWFRNLRIYRLTRPIDWSWERIEAALANKPARACASQEPSTYGFTAPIGKEPQAPLVHTAQGFSLIAARKEERLLPNGVIKDRLQEKIEALETQQMRKIYKKERDQLKEEVIHSLLPHAFIRKATVLAAIDIQQGLIFINTASTSKSEELLSALREALGSLPVRPLSLKQAPAATFTQWLQARQADAFFQILDECELRDTHEEGGSVRCKRQDLTSDEIQTHLQAGKRVTQLALSWREQLAFVLDETLAFRRLRFEDQLHEQAEQETGEDSTAQQDASFVLMMLTFRNFIPELIEALGGEDLAIE